MAELVSINQVRRRFSGNEDVEFEIACDRAWGDIPVTLSIWRGIEGDGKVKAQGQIQFNDEDSDMFTRSFTEPYNFDWEIDSLCIIWHISPDVQIWEIAQEGA